MLMHRICNLYLIIYKRKMEQSEVFFQVKSLPFKINSNKEI